MRDGMKRLAAVLGRRRRWVLVGWIAIVVLALPFASKQTEHLTGGGFDVPGSESKAVADSMQGVFARESGGVAVLLRAAPAASAAERAAAVERVRAEVAKVEGVSLSPAVARRAQLRLRRGDSTLIPLASAVAPDELIDPAVDLREGLNPGAAEAGVTTYLAGQPTVWAGMQELYNAVRNTAGANNLVLVGGLDYAYRLDQVLPAQALNPAVNVAYIQWYNANDATARWGIGHGAGAVYVSTTPGR